MTFCFCVPYVTRSSASRNRSFNEEAFAGYQVVNCGMVVLDEEAKTIRIFETTDPTREILCLDESNISEIECGRIRSENGTYRGGQVRFVASIDPVRGPESITLVLTIDEYR